MSKKALVLSETVHELSEVLSEPLSAMSRVAAIELVQEAQQLADELARQLYVEDDPLSDLIPPWDEP